MDSQKKLFWIGLAFVCFLIFSFGISEAYLWNNRIDQVDDSVECPVIPSLDGVVAKKSYTSQWRWKYADEDFGLDIESVCVSAYSNDGPSRILYKGELVGSSECTIWGCYFYDCHRNPLYYFEYRDSFFKLFAFKQDVTMVTYKLDGRESVEKTVENVIAMSNDEHFFGNNIHVLDKELNSVSRLYRPSGIALDLRWEFSATGNGTKSSAEIGAMDPRFLALMAGKLAFTDTEGGSYCNVYFWNVATMFIVFLVLLIGFLIYACYKGNIRSKVCPNRSSSY